MQLLANFGTTKYNIYASQNTRNLHELDSALPAVLRPRDIRTPALVKSF